MLSLLHKPVLSTSRRAAAHTRLGMNAQVGFQLEHAFAKSKEKPPFFAIKGKEQNSRAEFTCPAAQRGKRMLRPPTYLLPIPGLLPSLRLVRASQTFSAMSQQLIISI